MTSSSSADNTPRYSGINNYVAHNTISERPYLPNSYCVFIATLLLPRRAHFICRLSEWTVMQKVPADGIDGMEKQ